ncbi:hypothetical protein TCAL_16803 [Tigriopus californicus]|uniref:Uncharacterized protein n=1 Tax=Tigriopus californicus TaxID=6832 RepID=A0A553P9W9_TIGCA|nr:hypothetical protein TCAL_16803 [Tigriopus californicus]
MFAMKKRREYFPNGLDYNLNDPVLLSQISMTSGKHTIVRAKKRRPSIQNLEETKRTHKLRLIRPWMS